MKLFISWSGKRSQQAAEILRDWIKQLVQATDPWISPDIDKGSRWSQDVSNRLDESKVGIVCLTPDNLQSEWILFEAGALSKTKDALLCTFLLGLKPADVKQPLGQFQATRFDKEDIWKLATTINGRLAEGKLNDQTLSSLFDLLWPNLEGRLQKVLDDADGNTPARRTDRELLEEILSMLRTQNLGVDWTDRVSYRDFGNDFSNDFATSRPQFYPGPRVPTFHFDKAVRMNIWDKSTVDNPGIVQPLKDTPPLNSTDESRQ